MILATVRRRDDSGGSRRPVRRVGRYSREGRWLLAGARVLVLDVMRNKQVKE